MRLFVVLAVSILACASEPVAVELCDLNEISPILGSFGWNDSRTELVEEPVSAILLPCECEVHPELESFSGRDPIADANELFSSGDLYFLGLPILGPSTTIFSESTSDIERMPRIPTHVVEGADEHATCFAREKFEIEAMDYFGRFNSRILALALDACDRGEPLRGAECPAESRRITSP